MERRNFLTALVASVAGSELVLRATPAEVEAFAGRQQDAVGLVRLSPLPCSGPLFSPHGGYKGLGMSNETGEKIATVVGLQFDRAFYKLATLNGQRELSVPAMARIRFE